MQGFKFYWRRIRDGVFYPFSPASPVTARVNHDPAGLTLEVENQIYRPGDNVVVQVSLQAQESFYLRQGWVELACVETYYQKDGETPWGQNRWTYAWGPSAVPFLDEQQVLNGQSFSQTFTFSLPDDAAPSVIPHADPCAEIACYVQAHLDLPWAQDIHARQRIIVLPLVPDPSPSVPVLEQEIFDQCVVSLSLSSTTVRAGETVDGRFSIQVRQDLRVRNIRVELECWEKAGDKQKSTVEDMVLLKKNRLVGELLTANQVLDWPIQLQVPKNEMPSTEVHHTQVVWRVKGKLDWMEIQQQIQVSF